MATDYFSENETYIMNHPLPTPAGTPYGSMSRRTSRYESGSEFISSPSSPPDPRNGAEDAANDENISILDPRRFTPTLHANLVSEILSLRRELDSKHKFIEDLETNLHTERNEKESIAKQLASATKESKSAKRQLQHFENETIAALEEIAGERDKTKEANTELKEKLEAAQKKVRSQEEDSTRVHDMWGSEKDTWAEEKRALERRVHVSEARLKLLVAEISIHEATNEAAASDSEAEDAMREPGAGPESDTASIRSSPKRRPSTRLGRHSRNRSNGSYRSIGRNSRMSLIGIDGKVVGPSLADELVFDEEEEDLEDLELDSDDFPEHELRAIRALESRQSCYPDDKAKRILGLSNNQQQLGRDYPSVSELDEYATPPEVTHPPTILTPRDITLVFPPTRPIYVDTGVQPSPPPSPTKPAMREASSQTAEIPVQTKPVESPTTVAEIEANQRRKRVSIPLSPASPTSSPPARSLGTSNAAQPIGQPLSPPDTPKVTTGMDPSALIVAHRSEYTSMSTQTEAPEEPKESSNLNKRAAPPGPISVPSIAIHAPTSAPSSPKDPILPPGTKSVSTQTTGDLRAETCSTGMQTAPIRVDMRPIKLPAHLLPSAISSKPNTPEPKLEHKSQNSIERKDSHQPVSSDSEPSATKPTSRQDFMALLEKAADRKVENRYPGNNDNGPLSRKHQAEILNRPFRTSSLFAGFDGPSSDEEDNGEASEDDLRGHQYLSSMISSRNAKRPVKPPTPVPEDKEPTPTKPSEDSAGATTTVKRNSYEKPAKVGKPARNPIGRQSSIRRSALIQSGTAAHMRSRSPSLGSLGSNNYIPKPPFPVPTRSSSRNKPLSKSEGSASPTPRNNGSSAGRRPYAPKLHRKDSLRKVRSAAPVARTGRSRSRSPPLPWTSPAWLRPIRFPPSAK